MCIRAREPRNFLMIFPPEVSNGSHFRKVVVFMEGIRIMGKVKISCLKCCLMSSPSKFALDDSILLECCITG